MAFAQPAIAKILEAELGNAAFNDSPDPEEPSNSSPNIFDYQAMVKDVMRAPCQERHQFIKWICSSGVKAMLEPLLQAGLNINKLNKPCRYCVGTSDGDEKVISYLMAAMQSKNVGVFKSLITAGATYGTSEDPLVVFANTPRTLHDRVFIDSVIEESLRCPGNESYASMLLQYWDGHKSYWREPEPDLVIGEKLIKSGNAWASFPPHHLDHFLAVDLMMAVVWNNPRLVRLLLEQGASVEYTCDWGAMEEFTAVELAVELAYVEPLKLILSSMTGSETQLSFLRQALAVSKSNVRYTSANEIISFTSNPKFKPHKARQFCYHRHIIQFLDGWSHQGWISAKPNGKSPLHTRRSMNAFGHLIRSYHEDSDYPGYGITLEEVHRLLVEKIEELEAFWIFEGIDELADEIFKKTQEGQNGKQPSSPGLPSH
jgi:hypothetical protein